MVSFKTLSATALAAVMGLAATAASASDTANAALTLNVNAPQTCAVMGNVTASGDADVSGGSGGQGATLPGVTVDFGARLVDPVTGLPTFGPIRGRDVDFSHKVNLQIPAHCNYANSTVSIQSVNGGMRLQGGAVPTTGDFANGVGLYMVVNRVTGGTSRATVAEGNYTTPNQKTSGTVANAWNGRLDVTLAPSGAYDFSGGLGGRLTPVRDGTPMLAGTYSDTVRVRFGATSL